MDYNEILAEARTCIGTICKACPVCNGIACGNSMPGPGSTQPTSVNNSPVGPTPRSDATSTTASPSAEMPSTRTAP